jgi:hypothetical protein
MSRVFGDPDRLEAFTAEVTPTIGPTHGAVDDAATAVAAFNRADPNDLGSSLTDLAPVVRADLDLLLELDQAPAAFAFALRNLDELRTDTWNRVRADDLARFEALVTARLRDPYGGRSRVLEAAHAELDTSIVFPWHDEGSWAADPTAPVWWASTTIGAAERTVREVWDRFGVEVRGHYRGSTWVDAHGRWRPGWAGRLNPRIGRADGWRRTLPWARRVGRVLPAVPGVVQYVEDQDVAGLTTGDRVARAGAAALLEGGGAVAGGAAGAKVGAAIGGGIGTFILPGVGTAVGGAVGAVVGGVIGGWAGGEAGSSAFDSLQGSISSIGSGIDTAIDGVTDVGGSVVSTVRGWFGG